MSLKALHIVFIIASTLLCVGFSWWGWDRFFSPTGTTMDLVYGVSSLAALALLLWYGKYFLKKFKHLSYE